MKIPIYAVLLLLALQNSVQCQEASKYAAAGPKSGYINEDSNSIEEYPEPSNTSDGKGKGDLKSDDTFGYARFAYAGLIGGGYSGFGYGGYHSPYGYYNPYFFHRPYLSGFNYHHHHHHGHGHYHGFPGLGFQAGIHFGK